MSGNLARVQQAPAPTVRSIFTGKQALQVERVHRAQIAQCIAEAIERISDPLRHIDHLCQRQGNRPSSFAVIETDREDRISFLGTRLVFIVLSGVNENVKSSINAR